jgi:hypothetical protein
LSAAATTLGQVEFFLLGKILFIEANKKKYLPTRNKGVANVFISLPAPLPIAVIITVLVVVVIVQFRGL